MELEFQKKNLEQEEHINTKFTIMTYNVWFEEKYIQERTEKIIETIKLYEPDVICFQELTERSYEYLENKLTDIYYIFQIFMSEKNPYGCGIGCKRSSVEIIQQPYYYDYNNTKMSRRLIGCEVKIRGKHFHILNTHLESLPMNDHLRSLQFNTIKQVITPLSNVILCGDFNIIRDDEQINSKIANSKLYDSWIQIGCPSRICYTYNHKKNSNIKGKYQNRLDRIYYSVNDESDFNLEVKRMALTGLSKINNDIPIQPSDHFGLLAEFEIKDQD